MCCKTQIYLFLDHVVVIFIMQWLVLAVWLCRYRRYDYHLSIYELYLLTIVHYFLGLGTCTSVCLKYFLLGTPVFSLFLFNLLTHVIIMHSTKLNICHCGKNMRTLNLHNYKLHIKSCKQYKLFENSVKISTFFKVKTVDCKYNFYLLIFYLFIKIT